MMNHPVQTIFVLAVLIMFNSCKNPTEQDKKEMPTEGLLVHYSFNGNTRNKVSDIADGIKYNVTLTQNRFKNDSSAYYFNGYDSYIEVKSDTLFKPKFPLSISLWFKKTDNEQGWLFGNNLNPFKYMGVFIGFGDGNLLSLHFGNGFEVGAAYARRSVYAIDPIELSEWYHAVGVIESAEDMRLYLNGNEIATVYSGSASDMVYDNGDACLGRFYNWISQGPRHFKGMIDDFRLYNRVLSPEEIKLLYIEEN